MQYLEPRCSIVRETLIPPVYCSSKIKVIDEKEQQKFHVYGGPCIWNFTKIISYCAPGDDLFIDPTRQVIYFSNEDDLETFSPKFSG